MVNGERLGRREIPNPNGQTPTKSQIPKPNRHRLVDCPLIIDGETLTTMCIFGDEGSDPLLGALTLEQFSLGVDPVNRRLIAVVLPEA